MTPRLSTWFDPAEDVELRWMNKVGWPHLVRLRGDDGVRLWVEWGLPPQGRFVGKNLLTMKHRLIALSVFAALMSATQVNAASNGRFILFSAYGDNTPYQVFKIQLDGNGLERLSGRGSAYEPTWASSGQRIVYVAQDGIVIQASDGSHRRVLVKNGSAPRWSPDDSHILFNSPCEVEQPCHSRLILIRPDGTHRRTLARPGSMSTLSGASWSPVDGEIAYLKTRVSFGLHEGPVRDKLMVVDRRGENRRVLIRRQGLETYDWSPDGTKIVYSCLCGRDQHELFVIDVASRAVVRITHTAAFETDPAWSPDGDRIITVRWDSRLVTMDPDGSDKRVIASRIRGGAPSPSWSPDGDRVVFLRGDRSEIFVIDEEGSNERQVTDDRKDQVHPTWQPR